MMPTKFGLSFTARFLNQAGALVNIYKDGSVLITHGGTEMGQGLHTKMVQVTAQALGIPISKVHLSETQTATVPNTSATAASVSSDLNGMALLDACEKLNTRLEAYRQPGLTWEEIISQGKGRFEVLRYIISADTYQKHISTASAYLPPDSTEPQILTMIGRPMKGGCTITLRTVPVVQK